MTNKEMYRLMREQEEQEHYEAIERQKDVDNCNVSSGDNSSLLFTLLIIIFIICAVIY